MLGADSVHSRPSPERRAARCPCPDLYGHRGTDLRLPVDNWRYLPVRALRRAFCPGCCHRGRRTLPDFSDRVLEVAMRRRLALTRHDLNSACSGSTLRLGRPGTAREPARVRARDPGPDPGSRYRVVRSGSGPSGSHPAGRWRGSLTAASICTAQWPWSLLWISVRRAVRGEWASGVYLTKARTAGAYAAWRGARARTSRRYR